jgi:hypothetical protein
LYAKRLIIQKGDLVFYKDNSGKWAHVAIVVGWGKPTNFGLKTSYLETGIVYPASGSNIDFIETLPKINVPIFNDFTVVTRAPIGCGKEVGKIGYDFYRSLDNTADKVKTISIVLLKDYFFITLIMILLGHH